MLECKDCKYFDLIGEKWGICNNPHNYSSFPMVNKNNSCILRRTKLICQNCKYWIKEENIESDLGACTYEKLYFPMFADERCMLKYEYLKQAEKENGIKG